MTNSSKWFSCSLGPFGELSTTTKKITEARAYLPNPDASSLGWVLEVYLVLKWDTSVGPGSEVGVATKGSGTVHVS